MKIEKINDYQIRCTLTRDDLLRRDMKVSELAYGTSKARALFQDMIDQAAESFGFDLEDMPVMIEAIPFNSECLVLVITKCDDPDELDTRFAYFAPSIYYDEDDEYGADDMPEDFASLFSRIQEGGMTGLGASDAPGAKKVKQKVGGKQQKYTDDAEYRIFSFPLLMNVIAVAKRIDEEHLGQNSLYRHKGTGQYLLLLHREKEKDDAVFAKTCLILSEYGKEEHVNAASEQFLNEQGSVVIAKCALQTLRKGAGV